MLVQSPYIKQDGFGQPAASTKRSRAEIATPRKPGSDEARTQLAMEYIATPARAPPAMKRPMRSVSPTGWRPVGGTDGLFGGRAGLLDSSGLSLVERTRAALLSSGRDPAVPRFSLSPTDSIDTVDMAVDQPEPTSDEAVFGSPSVTAPRAQPAVSPLSEAKLGVESLRLTSAQPDSPPRVSTMADSMSEDAHEATVSITGDLEPEAPLGSPAVQPESPMAMADDEEQPASPEAMAVDDPEPEEPALETAAVVVDTVSPETVLEAALKAVEPAAQPHAEAQPLAAISHARIAGVGRAELTTARIFDDPDLMTAAAVPLPNTPSMGRQAATPLRTPGIKGSPDFYIPTDWLMNPGTSTRRAQQGGAADSPLKRYSSPPGGSDGGSLIPVTPANQQLLDSLEIQWVSPQQVPKFSDADVSAIRADYEERMRRQNELREKLLQTLKDEYAENMRKQEERAEQVLKEAEDLFQAHIEQREREFAVRLEEEQLQHQQELARELGSAANERAGIIAERDELRTMLDDYVATSTKLLDERESEGAGLTRELGKLTLERQRLQEQLDETHAQATALAAERSEAQARADALSAEATRLEQLAAALRNDVLVAEERSTKIKSYAESTLTKANDEITSTHQQLAASREETATLKSQAVKADARARSLQIQLDSMKRQNEELLKLCEGLGV
ncbi:hypothetical protein IWQ57_002650 [Coemansia nantahalensis]|uniref:Uncharacterized protein n=1 Tax=Coemansia nantahalensis TaxID=2789366 RepID=A0ACC1JZP6_9FUNG|nr:hypothetical protein IWQ57_002650 [Coemansia nantahalensis]